MSTKSKTDINSILNFSDDEKFEFEMDMIHFDLLNPIIEYMGDMTRRDLAKKLKVSPSYVTQLFTGDKRINIDLIAKLQRIFDVKLTAKYVTTEFIDQKNLPGSKTITFVVTTNNNVTTDTDGGRESESNAFKIEAA